MEEEFGGGGWRRSLEEEFGEKKKGYYLSKKVTYFFRENLLYPYVNIKEGKRGLTLSMTDYTDILNYIEMTGYAHL